MTKRERYQLEKTSESKTETDSDRIYSNTLIESVPTTSEDNHEYDVIEKKDASPMQKEVSLIEVITSLRRLKAICFVLVAIMIGMAITIGVLMSELKKRVDATEGKIEVKTDEDTASIQRLTTSTTRLGSNLQDLFDAFLEINNTIIQEHTTKIAQLESDRSNDLATIQRFNTRITDLEDQPIVGFTARNRKDSYNGALRYNNIITAVGRGYNFGTGVFTCPVTGLYLVSMTLQVESDGKINCFLYKNGSKTYPEIDINGKGQESASQTAVMQLNTGDTLYIGSCDESNVGDESTFTVVLIHATD